MLMENPARIKRKIIMSPLGVNWYNKIDPMIMTLINITKQIKNPMLYKKGFIIFIFFTCTIPYVNNEVISYKIFYERIHLAF